MRNEPGGGTRRHNVSDARPLHHPLRWRLQLLQSNSPVRLQTRQTCQIPIRSASIPGSKIASARSSPVQHRTYGWRQNLLQIRRNLAYRPSPSVSLATPVRSNHRPPPNPRRHLRMDRQKPPPVLRQTKHLQYQKAVRDFFNFNFPSVGS